MFLHRLKRYFLLRDINKEIKELMSLKKEKDKLTREILTNGSVDHREPIIFMAISLFITYAPPYKQMILHKLRRRRHLIKNFVSKNHAE